MNPQRFFTETASLEVRTGVNHYTGNAYADPQTIRVRRAGDSDLVRDEDGNEVVTQEHVATLTPLALGDRITLDGTPRTIVKVHQVRDVRGRTTHYVGWVA